MMKIYTILLILFVTAIAVSSCKKDSNNQPAPQVTRKIQFKLYTNKDFSTNSEIITFQVVIRNSSKTLWDSTFSPMQIKDIPDSTHKLVIEKIVPGNDNSDLAAGFVYTIQNVGESWYIDTSKAGNTFKVIDYAFQ